jgi:hypothetical protein
MEKIILVLKDFVRKNIITMCKQNSTLFAVFRIHNFLVWIRIRGSMPLTNGSGSGPCYFRH